MQLQRVRLPSFFLPSGIPLWKWTMAAVCGRGASSFRVSALPTILSVAASLNPSIADCNLSDSNPSSLRPSITNPCYQYRDAQGYRCVYWCICLYCVMGQTAILLNFLFAIIVVISMFQLPFLHVISKPGFCKFPAYNIAASNMLRAEQLHNCRMADRGHEVEGRVI